jgi:hypothetical protein
MVVAEVVMAPRRAMWVMDHEGPRGPLDPTPAVVVVDEAGLGSEDAPAFLLETPLPRGTMASNCLEPRLLESGRCYVANVVKPGC